MEEYDISRMRELLSMYGELGCDHHGGYVNMNNKLVCCANHTAICMIRSYNEHCSSQALFEENEYDDEDDAIIT